MKSLILSWFFLFAMLIAAAQAPSQKLDSTVFSRFIGQNWTRTDKTEFFYNSDGLLGEMVVYEWNGERRIPYTKTLFGYDMRGVRVSHESYEWDTVTGQWLNTSKHLVIYDANGKESSIESYDGRHSTTWWKNYRIEFTYDSASNLLTKTDYGGGITPSINWIPVRKEENTYSADGDRLGYVVYEWDSSGQWIAVSRNNRTYDANHNIIFNTLDLWDPQTGQWVNDNTYKSEYIYDTIGRILTQLDFKWITASQTWQLVNTVRYAYDSNDNRTLYQAGAYRHEYGFDASGNKLFESYSQILGNDTVFTHIWKDEYSYNADGYEIVSYNWDNQLGQWMLHAKTAGKYDPQGHLALMLEYQWDNQTGQWLVLNKYQYQFGGKDNLTDYMRDAWFRGVDIKQWQHAKYLYDESADIGDIVLPPVGTVGLPSSIYTAKLLVTDDTTWNAQINSDSTLNIYSTSISQTEYYYSTLYSGLNENSTDNELVLYPNPAGNIVNLKLPPGEHNVLSISVYDLTGRLLLKEEKPSIRIDITRLSPGVYFLTADTGTKRFVVKMIKNG